MTVILYSLISFLGWGIGDFFGVFGARKLGAASYTAWGFLFCFIFTLSFAPFFLEDFALLTWDVFLFNLALGFVFLLSCYSFNRAMVLTSPSLVGVISGAWIGLTVVLSLIFFGESISIYQGGAIGVVLLGLSFAVFDFRGMSVKLIMNKGILYSFITLLLWGMYFAFLGPLVDRIGWYLPIFICTLVFPLAFLLPSISGEKLSKPTKNGALIFLVLAAILGRSADLNMGFALESNPSSIVIPIGGAYPIVLVILSSIFFKEKLLKTQWFGIVVTLFGIISLSVFS